MSRHRVKQIEKQRQQRVEWKAAGICIYCGKLPATKGHGGCEKCFARMRNTRLEKNRQGLCAYCAAKRPTEPGKSVCKECDQRIKDSTNKRIEIRRNSGLCLQCGKCPPRENRVNCALCARKLRNKQQHNKETCFDHYGYVCTCCCIEYDIRFLTLDHVNNDGAAHRKAINKKSIYYWAIKNDFPDSLQTHCWNCNCGKENNGGICPHQENDYE